MKLLVIGAGGFAGRHLCPRLVQDFGPDAVIDHRFDITDRAAVFATLARHQPDICLHLAAIAAIGTARADPRRAWEVNLHGSLNIADAILAHAPACHLIFISSAEVYGASFRHGQALDETAPLAPLNLYAATKAAAELALSAMSADGLRLLRLRAFNHTGPGQPATYVVPAFARQIARIEAGHAPPEMLVGALTPEREFLDVRDVCAAYSLAAKNAATLPNNTILNIASGHPTPIGAMLDHLLTQTKSPITTRPDPALLRPIEIARSTGNATLARKLLGWEPQIPMIETLNAVLEYERQQI